MSREILKLEYTRLSNCSSIGGLPSIKDQLILLIFVYHLLIPLDLQKSPRDELFAYLKKKYPFGILEGETSQNLEEILIDLFENEVLLDSELDTIRSEFQQFKASEEIVICDQTVTE